MRLPDYLAPATLDEALERLRQAGDAACLAAGGTDLLPQLRRGAIQPSLVIDLRRLPLATIRQEADGVEIGACATHAAVAASPLIRQGFPALAEACRTVGGPPVRNRGTLGGNLANASPAADAAPPLLAYDAEVVLARQGAERTLPLAELFTGPGQTALAADEMLIALRLPLPPENTGAAFIKLGKRQAMAIAVASVAARLTLAADGRIREARLALGSVAPVPLRALRAETHLQGHGPTVSLIGEAAELARPEASPISDVRASAGYRSRMVEVLARRALTAAWQAAQGAE